MENSAAMDYDSIHGPGISNFSPSSPSRPKTVSAAQALRELRASPNRYISTGLVGLDAALQNKDYAAIADSEVFHGGVSKGTVTEIYGPPGAGKTALAMQLAASALYNGDGVTWVDASHPLPGPRFSQILTSFRPPSHSTVPALSQSYDRGSNELLSNLTHFSAPSLAHLIALLCNQTPTHPEPNTSLIIVDSFSTLINIAFPRTANTEATPKKPGAPNPGARKFPILQYLINSLQRLASTRNIAIVVISQCVTKMRPGEGAFLVPTINTPPWEQGLGCRVALFRDWGWNDDEGNPVTDVRLVQIVKAEGVAAAERKERIVGFSIKENGLHTLLLPIISIMPSPQKRFQLPQNPVELATPTLPRPPKRKLSETDIEIPDSDGEDDEDYGWGEDDEDEMPPMPPQTQGSEDILVIPENELEAEEIPMEDENPKDGSPEDEEGNRHLPNEIMDSEDELA